MKRLLLLATIALIPLTGCSGWKNSISKMGNALTAGDYKVTVWNGGLPVAEYFVKNSFVNTEVDSDGYFFFVDGKLVRVTGTITIEQQ
jgi:hypothetical protein